MIEATLLFPLVCAALAILGMPLWTAMVGPNRFYGVRTPATLADEALWYAVNRATGRDIVVAGMLSLVLSVLLPESGIGGAPYPLVMAIELAAASAFVAVVALARVRYLRSPL